MKFYWNALPCHVPPLPCSLLLDPGPEWFCFPDSNLVFLWMNIGVSRLTKDNAVKPSLGGMKVKALRGSKFPAPPAAVETL